MLSSLQQITQLIHEKFGINSDTLKSTASLSEFGLDSLALVELIFAIEEHFDIEIPDTPSGEVKTLAGLATLVDELVAAKK